MPTGRHRGMMEGLMTPAKIRKRECSSSSSSSSRIHTYRLNKRAILVGKGRVGLGIGSRSNTPAPTWRNTPLRGGTIVESPKYSQSGRSTQPVSARRLAATLWGMNEVMPSPRVSERDLEVMNQQQQKKKNGSSKMVFKREKMQSGWGSGSLPPHLSDPSHSPTVSEKMDRSRTNSRQRTPSISQRLRSVEQNVAAFDSISNASFMEIETRSRPPTSNASVYGGKNRLKDISNALITSKELLKIISRMWAHADQPSSTMSVISALHAELERARMQANHLIQEQRLEKNEINHLMKCFAEEKASWKNKEHQAIEAAIGSISNELEVERKLRKRVESLNKKLGKELAEMKSSFIKAVKDLESEKRAREITEQVCDELARNVDEDNRGDVEMPTNRLTQVNYEGVEKERDIIKVSEAKHQSMEKNSAISKLRKQLDVFLGTKREKQEERETCPSKSKISSLQHKQQDEREVEESTIIKDRKDEKLLPVDEMKPRNSISGQIPRRKSGDVNAERYHELEKELAQRTSGFEETQRYKGVKGNLPDHVLSSSRLSSVNSSAPCQQREQSWPLRDPLGGLLQERHTVNQATGSKSRMVDVRGEGHGTRRSKW